MNNISLMREELRTVPLRLTLYGVCLLALAACAGDELTGDLPHPLPEGKYPLRLSTSLLVSDSARTKVSDNNLTSQWTAGDKIGVIVSKDAQQVSTSACTLNTDGSVSAYDPQLYWQTTGDYAINAWYSNISGASTTDNTHTVSLADQSSRLAYVLKAKEATANYKGGDVSLVFSHQLARVDYTLKPGAGFTAEELKGATVEVRGYTNATITRGSVSPSGSLGWIKPCGNAVSLIPYTIGTTGSFIRIKVGDKTFNYTPQSKVELKVGYRYSFTVTAKWGVYEGMSWTSTDVKPGDYVYSDGTISDGGLRAVFANGKIQKEDVGPLTSKTCQGIIFHVRRTSSPADNCTYGSFTGAPTGYIVSLDQKESQWCTVSPNSNDGTPITEINGYTYTAAYASKYGSNKNLIAIPWCTSHTQIAATSAAAYSTWYMPSQLEYKEMRGEVGGRAPILAVLEANLAKVSGATAFVDKFYFTSGLMGAYGNYLHMYNLKTGSIDAGYFENKFDRTFPYRAVCAFQLK